MTLSNNESIQDSTRHAGQTRPTNHPLLFFSDKWHHVQTVVSPACQSMLQSQIGPRPLETIEGALVKLTKGALLVRISPLHGMSLSASLNPASAPNGPLRPCQLELALSIEAAHWIGGDGYPAHGEPNDLSEAKTALIAHYKQHQLALWTLAQAQMQHVHRSAKKETPFDQTPDGWLDRIVKRCRSTWTPPFSHQDLTLQPSPIRASTRLPTAPVDGNRATTEPFSQSLVFPLLSHMAQHQASKPAHSQRDMEALVSGSCFSLSRSETAHTPIPAVIPVGL